MARICRHLIWNGGLRHKLRLSEQDIPEEFTSETWKEYDREQARDVAAASVALVA